MKILLTSDLFMPQVNGVVISFMNLYNELKAKGHDVKILTLSKEDRSYVDGDFCFVRSFGLNIYEGIRATVALNSHIVSYLIDWKPDIIHSQCEFFTYSLALRVAKKCNIPIVHTYHTMYEHYVNYLIPGVKVPPVIVGKVMKSRLEGADIIIAPTKKVKRSLESFEITGTVRVIPTGIDLSKYSMKVSEEVKSSLRTKLGIDKDKKVLINLGRIAKEKNIDELIFAFSKLSQKRNDTVFLIVGAGPHLEDLKNLSHNLELDDKIIFTGMVDPKECINYYQLSDIFLSASISETQGLTYIEALANSLVEIVRKDDAVEGVIENGVNGFIYESEDGLITALNKLLNDDILREEMSKNAYEKSLTFSTDVFSNSVLKIYEEAIDNFIDHKWDNYIGRMKSRLKVSRDKIVKTIKRVKS